MIVLSNEYLIQTSPILIEVVFSKSLLRITFFSKNLDFAKAIAKSVGKENIEFHKIPIRNGEKLHEEMISAIEMQRISGIDFDE